MKRIILLLLLSALMNIGNANAYSVEQAKQDLNLSRYALTIDELSHFLNDNQTDYEAWFLFGVANVHEQKYTQAIEAFRHVIALRPDLAEPHNNLAAVYSDLDDSKAAVKELELALKKRPNYAVAEENLADLYVRLALQHYHNILKHAPNPIIEQRYASLLQVRNPINNSSSTPIETTAVKSEPNVATVKETMPAAKPATQAMVEPQITKPVETASTIKPTPPIKVALGSPQASNISQPQQIADTSITGVLDALEAWRLAWAAQDLDSYFSAYAHDYKPDDRYKTLAVWKKYKSRVINNKAYIHINFEQVQVDTENNKKIASVLFLQRFDSDRYKADNFKKVTFKYTPHGWKIIKEISIK